MLRPGMFVLVIAALAVSPAVTFAQFRGAGSTPNPTTFRKPPARSATVRSNSRPAVGTRSAGGVGKVQTFTPKITGNGIPSLNSFMPSNASIPNPMSFAQSKPANPRPTQTQTRVQQRTPQRPIGR